MNFGTNLIDIFQSEFMKVIYFLLGVWGVVVFFKKSLHMAVAIVAIAGVALVFITKPEFIGNLMVKLITSIFG